MAEYQLTISSSTADKLEASRQLAAAKTEWNDFLRSKQKTIDIGGQPSIIYDSGKPGLGWAQVAEPKLNEILQKYPYVTASTGGKLVSDTLVIRTDGSVPSQSLGGTSNRTFPPEVPNTDDAYPLASGDKGLPKINSSGTNPYDPSRLNKTTSQPAASDSVGNSEAGEQAQARPAKPPIGTGSKVRDDRSPLSDKPYPSPNNESAVTSNQSLAQDATVPRSSTAVASVNPTAAVGIGNAAPIATSASDDVGSISGVPTGVANSGTNSPRVSIAAREPDGTGGTPLNRRIKVRPNLLHSYANWTYQVGWYMLDINTYNAFVENGVDSPSLRQRPIMVTGGSKKNNSGLNNDLYLQDLKFSAVIGNNKSSPNANLFQIEMNVVEPYSVSLLAELKSMADQMGGDQQQFQIPYLLEVKFLGYDDRGKIVTNIQDTGPKLIPVTIVNITFSITSAGTVYNISMVPTGQTALGSTHGVLRKNFRVYGGTLKEQLVEGQESLKEALRRDEQAMVNPPNGSPLAEKEDTYEFVVKSFDASGAPNDDLMNSPITFVASGVSQSLMPKRTMGSDKPNDPTKEYYEIPGGSNIKDVLQRIVMVTKYFQDSVTPENPNSQDDKPLQIIKVIPVVKYGPFDKIRQRYQRQTIYKITTYFKYGQRHPAGGQAKVNQGLLAKEYNWLFTGKNDDIINIDLQYNLQYFQIFENASPEKGAFTTGAITVEDRKPYSTNPGNSENLQALVATEGQVSNTFSRGSKDTAVKEIFDQQLNSPTNADQITLDMTIIGDPDWIPQDLSIRPQGSVIKRAEDGFINTSIATDIEASYAVLRFKTPRDYSDQTGLMQLTNNQTQIEGVYQVITVDSVFENGKFTQVLNMVRVPNQDENKPKPTTNPANIGSSSNPTALPASRPSSNPLVNISTATAPNRED